VEKGAREEKKRVRMSFFASSVLKKGGETSAVALALGRRRLSGKKGGTDKTYRVNPDSR